MNKRILSLLLVAIMLICMIPAVSLVSYADEPQTPAVGTYEYYEHMWYDDGHLLSFVDLTHMTDADFVANSESLELEDTDYRFVTGKTGTTTTQGLRTYVKIVDGKNAGRYYLLTIDARANGEANGDVLDDYQFSSNSEGNAYIPGRANGGYTHGVDTGIWLAYAYTADEVITPMEEGIASATKIDDEINYGSESALNTFTVDIVLDYNTPSVSANAVSLLSVCTKAQRSAYMSSSSTEKFGDSNVTAQNRTDSYYLLGGYQPSDGEVSKFFFGYNGRFGGGLNPGSYGGVFEDGDSIHIAYNIRYTTTTTFEFGQTVLMKSGSWNSTSANSPKSTVASSEYPSYGAYIDLSALMANIPYMSNMYFLRMYDTALTEEQLKQNHFADLCYYYGVDLTVYNSLAKKFKDKAVDSCKTINLGDTQYAKSDVEKAISGVLADAMPYIIDATSDYSTKVADTELAKYIGLYYDDGHLMSMLNLSDIEDSDVVYNGENAEINGARIVLGNKHESGGVYDSYAKILAGKYAGEYYLLGNQAESDKYNLKIEIDEEGFIKYNEFFHQWGARDVGVKFSYTYDESDLVTASPRPKNNSSFIWNTDYIQYDGTYGNFTMEGVYRMACSYYPTGANQAKDIYALLLSIGYHRGMFVIKTGKNNQAITSFYSGTTHGDGTQREVNYAVDETYHYMARVAFTEPTVMFRSIYVYHHKEGMVTTRSGKENGYNLNEVGNDRSKFAAQSQGMKMYLLRFYDVSLTPLQMKQNHFADLCYYYGLENIDALLTLGSYTLTEEFYDGFAQFRVGMCDKSQIQTMQSSINNAVARALDAGRLVEEISSRYSLALSNAESSAAALNEVSSILSGIDAYIEHVSSITPLNEECEAIFEQCISDLQTIKDNINLYYLIVGNYDKNVQAVKEIATEIKNASTSSTAVSELMENYIALEKKMHFSTEGAAHNAQFARLAAEGSTEIARIVAVANSTNAQISFDATDYVRFSGYQVRITDYAAMRALFAVDSEAIAAGYTYNEMSYEIVCLGFLIADAANENIEVTYDGEYAYTEASGAIIRYADEWIRNSELDSTVSQHTGMVGAHAYTFVKEYDGADVPSLADEFQKEYKLRAFMVLEGEGTQFIRYLDVDSVNVGETVSIYELSKYASTVESADKLTDDSYITYVITTVEGKKD